MWKKELPTKAGYYWTITKEDGINGILPMIVGNIGEGQTYELGCMLSGQDEPVSLKQAEERILYWYGPINAPELPEEIKSEVGELQEVT